MYCTLRTCASTSVQTFRNLVDTRDCFSCYNSQFLDIYNTNNKTIVVIYVVSSSCYVHRTTRRNVLLRGPLCNKRFCNATMHKYMHRSKFVDKNYDSLYVCFSHCDGVKMTSIIASGLHTVITWLGKKNNTALHFDNIEM